MALVCGWFGSLSSIQLAALPDDIRLTRITCGVSVVFISFALHIVTDNYAYHWAFLAETDSCVFNGKRTSSERCWFLAGVCVAMACVALAAIIGIIFALCSTE